MKTFTKTAMATLAAMGFAGSASAAPLISQPHPENGVLSKIGKSVTYPIKKAAGNGSKAANHGGKAVVYPVRKAGVNTSKTVHKALPKKQ